MWLTGNDMSIKTSRINEFIGENRFMSSAATRIGILRQRMLRDKIDFVLIGSSDYHASEYVGDFFKVSEFFSGCTSDNVKLIIGQNTALLWTDGRYFISAASELMGSGIRLMKSGEPGVPTVEAFLRESLHEGMTLAFDGLTIDALNGRCYRDIADKAGARVVTDLDPADGIWMDRPSLPSHKIMLLSDDLTGESMEEKLNRVREQMRKKGAVSHMISKLDDICWLFNIRGRDVKCNPVALSHCFITMENAFLFLQDEERTEEFDAWALEKSITVRPYASVLEFLENYNFKGTCMFEPGAVSCCIADIIRSRTSTLETDNPTEAMKAVKNPVEISHIKKCYLEDSVQLCRFICWFAKNIGRTEITEISAAEYLDDLRAQIPGFLELSFPTISAYGPNAAMAHYAATKESHAVVGNKGFLLVDSGGQYLGGTTDVTRTMTAGELTDEERRDFTLVTVANLNLLNAKFRYGVTGRFLDAYARAPLWEYGMDYNHGTGHGIGYILNVHEGPHNIRWRYIEEQKEALFEPGMIVSDEPGIYIEGRYGIRIETIMLTVEDETNAFGRFLKFEPLTYAPIDLDAIDFRYMQPKDIKRLNEYHALVREKISPYLNGEELEWLIEATREVGQDNIL